MSKEKLFIFKNLKNCGDLNTIPVFHKKCYKLLGEETMIYVHTTFLLVCSILYISLKIIIWSINYNMNIKNNILKWKLKKERQTDSLSNRKRFHLIS